MPADLDTRANVEQFVDAFYARLLADPLLAPIFVDVAAVDLSVHLPHIKDYWCKLLLGEQGYQRHTMAIHRQLHARRALTSEDFTRWLGLFEETLDEGYAGPHAEKARRIATAIAGNMQQGLPD
jgi:hemoglobin